MYSDSRSRRLVVEGNGCGCERTNCDGECADWAEGIIYSERMMEKVDRDFIRDGNIVFGLSTDGMAPFVIDDKSVWPIALTVYNICPHYRSRPENLEVVGLLPGNRDPKTLNPFFEHLMRDVERWNAEGGVPVEYMEGGQAVQRRVKAQVVRGDFDFPARQKVS